MYSGLLPRGLCSDSDSESDAREAAENEEGKRDGGDCSTALRCEEETHSSGSAGNLPGVSPRMLQKFTELRDKNKEIKMQLSKVRQQRRKRHKKGKTDKETDSTLESDEKGNLQTEREDHWNELKQYFGVNDRFQPPPCSRSHQKTGLERSIDSAIAEGDYEKAEELSNSLATRELAVKITNAVDCRDFAKTKQEAETSRVTLKRKKQIAWGFEAKKRWETKSNMGYM